MLREVVAAVRAVWRVVVSGKGCVEDSGWWRGQCGW